MTSQTKMGGAGIAHTGKTPGRFKMRYPWETWFKMGRVTLVRGTDFECLPHGMRQNALAAAKRVLPRSKRLRLSVNEHTLTIEVVPRTAKERAA